MKIPYLNIVFCASNFIPHLFADTVQVWQEL